MPFQVNDAFSSAFRKKLFKLNKNYLLLFVPSGQRSAEIVRPLLHLLDINCSALQNFEALMALTNLAQIDHSIQSLILKDDGFSKIEHYIYEDHEMLVRASVECLVNLIRHTDVVKRFEAENDRIKCFVYLCQSNDLQTALAAAGGLAMITNVSKKCCEKVFESEVWTQTLIMLVRMKIRTLNIVAYFWSIIWYKRAKRSPNVLQTPRYWMLFLLSVGRKLTIYQQA